MVDRVESTKAEKFLLFLKLALGLLVLIVIVMIMANLDKIDSLRLSHFKPFTLVAIMSIGVYFRIVKNTGQFIEWTDDIIRFKTRKSAGEIEVSSIREIKVGLDDITIELKHCENYILDIQDFINYDSRRRIKDNFHKISKNLS